MLNFLAESFLLGLKNLRLHKLRSLLTALGIILGVSAVIVMVAIGEGTKQQALEQMQQLGARNIVVQSVRPPEGTDAGARTSRVLEYGLKRLDYERLKTLPGVVSVVPLRNTEQKIVSGPRLASGANAIGTTPELFPLIHLKPAEGETFSQMHYQQGESGGGMVCVLGAKVAKDLFPYEDPLGQSVQVGGGRQPVAMLTVIGVLEPVGLRPGSEGASIMRLDPDQSVYFPLSLAQKVFRDAITKQQAGSFERKVIELTEVWLEAGRNEDVEPLAASALNTVGLSAPGRRDVDVKAPIQILRNAERLSRMFNFIMGGTAAISLIVGGIGIMNIMLATVTERTKEIGIRRALGAKQRHITLQFLIETTVISLTGGLLGIALGIGSAKLLPVVVLLIGQDNYRTSIAQWSVVGSFVISGVIGIGFGLYPAMTAARMNPIEALRHE